MTQLNSRKKKRNRVLQRKRIILLYVLTSKSWLGLRQSRLQKLLWVCSRLPHWEDRRTN